MPLTPAAFLLHCQLTHQCASACVCWDEYKGQSSVGMTSAATVMAHTYQTLHRLISHVCICLCMLLIYSISVYICAALQLACCGCTSECVCTHFGGDKRALGVSRGEGLWNMESSRVVLCVTPVL